MHDIGIGSADYWIFNFSTCDVEIQDTKQQYCSYCDTRVHRAYSFIIESLKEAKLLPDDYKQMCCYCAVLQEFGLMDLRKDLCNFFYDNNIDILKIYFAFEANKNEIDWDNRYCFTIHDFSKVFSFKV